MEKEELCDRIDSLEEKVAELEGEILDLRGAFDDAEFVESG